MISKHKFLRAGLGSLMLAFLLSCGGGSSVDGSLAGLADKGVTLSGSSGGDGTGGDSSAGGSGNSAADGGDSGSTSTAANGSDNGSGVGSGGTGVSADAASAVGSVDGMGSIIVSGVRYDIDKIDPAMVDLRDTAGTDWQLGMTVEVTGPVDATFATGTATKLKSMAQMRGEVESVASTPGSSTGTISLLGNTVSVDDETVWADLPGLSSLQPGTQVLVWALPVAPGLVLATRIETQAVTGPVLVTGMISGMNSSTFQLGGLTVDYSAAAVPADTLAEGRIVRVTATAAPVGNLVYASQVESWYALSKVKDAPVQVEGVIAGYTAKASPFTLLGVTIDGSSAAVTGGQESKLNNGVRVVASGVLSPSGVLVASQIKIRHVPGGGALPTYYDLHGTIENYVSPSSLRVRGVNGVQRVDISAANISNPAAGTLANGQKVRVQGSQVVGGVLKVTELAYE